MLNGRFEAWVWGTTRAISTRPGTQYDAFHEVWGPLIADSKGGAVRAGNPAAALPFTNPAPGGRARPAGDIEEVDVNDVDIK